MPRLCTAVALVLMVFTRLGAQEPEPPPAEVETSPEETVTVETDGERPDAVQADLDAVKQKIALLTNAFRKEQEREPIEVQPELSAAAAKFAAFMARTNRYGHAADKQTPPERLAAEGYEPCIAAENIAYRFRTSGFDSDELAGGFVAGWKESPTHRRNMLDPNVIATGVAVAKSESSDVYYAVQVFARPRSAAIRFEVVNDFGGTIHYRVGQRDYSIAAGQTRTHTECKPTVVRFVTRDPDLKSSHPDGVYAQFRVTGGERLRARPAP